MSKVILSNHLALWNLDDSFHTMQVLRAVCNAHRVRGGNNAITGEEEFYSEMSDLKLSTQWLQRDDNKSPPTVELIGGQCAMKTSLLR